MESKTIFAVVLSGSLATVGCSGDASDVPMDAGPVDTGTDGEGTPTGIAWERCGAFECATLDVPLDYDEPEGATVGIRILRREAIEDDRVGVLMFNPGGPAIPVTAGALRYSSTWADLAPRFDLVLMDNRGTGESHPVRCGELADFEDELRDAPVPIEDLADAEAHERLWQRLFDGCVEMTGAELLRHINSENVARDMDAVREALGEDELNFVGASYGTVQGALYATFFPDRVRAFVLDSPVGWYLDNPADNEERAIIWDAAIQGFFEACGSDAACSFHGGEGAAAVEAAWVALRDELATGTVEWGGFSRTPTHLDDAMNAGMRPADLTPLADALTAAEGGDWDTLLTMATRLSAVDNELFFEIAQPGQAIRLADMGCPDGFDAQALVDAAASLRAATAYVELNIIGASCTVYDLERSEPRQSIGPTTAPPLLIMVGEHDPAVSVGDALDMQNALDNGSHIVTWEGWGHAVGPKSDCTRSALSTFLVDPSPPAVESCAQTAGHFQ